MSLEQELAKFKKAAKAAKTFPGAVMVARGILKRLLWDPDRLTERARRDIEEYRKLLPTGWVELITCPVCNGGGTQRWMVSYRHKCNRCGGWGRVAKTPDVVRETEYIWGQGSNA
jgi:hypothetical protein